MSQESRSGCLGHANWAGITGIVTILMLILAIWKDFVPSHEIVSFLSSIHFGSTGTPAPTSTPSPPPNHPSQGDSFFVDGIQIEFQAGPTLPLFVQLLIGAAIPSLLFLFSWSEMNDWEFQRILLLALCIFIGMLAAMITGFLSTLILAYDNCLMQLIFIIDASIYLPWLVARLFARNTMNSDAFVFPDSSSPWLDEKASRLT